MTTSLAERVRTEPRDGGYDSDWLCGVIERAGLGAALNTACDASPQRLEVLVDGRRRSCVGLHHEDAEAVGAAVIAVVDDHRTLADCTGFELRLFVHDDVGGDVLVAEWHCD